MASKRIEELMQQASAKDQAAFKESVQTLKDNNVQLKANSYGPQAPARRAEQPHIGEPKLNETVFPNQQKPEQRGIQKIEQAKTKMQTKAAEPSKAQEKNTPAQSQDRER